MEGFLIETTDWYRYNEFDEYGNLYPVFMFEIDGDLWIQVYHGAGEETNFVKHETDVSQTVLGLTGLMNIYFTIWVWIKFLGG